MLFLFDLHTIFKDQSFWKSRQFVTHCVSAGNIFNSTAEASLIVNANLNPWMVELRSQFLIP